jgi:hypothetical protein
LICCERCEAGPAPEPSHTMDPLNRLFLLSLGPGVLVTSYAVNPRHYRNNARRIPPSTLSPKRCSGALVTDTNIFTKYGPLKKNYQLADETAQIKISPGVEMSKTASTPDLSVLRENDPNLFCTLSNSQQIHPYSKFR